MKYILIIVFSWWVSSGSNGKTDKAYEVEMQEFNSLDACKEAKQDFKDLVFDDGMAICVQKGT